MFKICSKFHHVKEDPTIFFVQIALLEKKNCPFPVMIFRWWLAVFFHAKNPIKICKELVPAPGEKGLCNNLEPGGPLGWWGKRKDIQQQQNATEQRCWLRKVVRFEHFVMCLFLWLVGEFCLRHPKCNKKMPQTSLAGWLIN